MSKVARTFQKTCTNYDFDENGPSIIVGVLIMVNTYKDIVVRGIPYGRRVRFIYPQSTFCSASLQLHMSTQACSLCACSSSDDTADHNKQTTMKIPRKILNKYLLLGHSNSPIDRVIVNDCV